MEKLITEFAKKSGLSIEEAGHFIAVFVQIMEEELTQKDSVHIDGLRVYKKLATANKDYAPKPQVPNTNI